MRGWTILVVVLLCGLALILGPPAFLEPSVRAVPDSVWHFFGWLYFGLFAYPGRWVLLHIWSGFFDPPAPRLGPVLIALFAWIFSFVFSYFFWLIVLSRFWKLIG